MYHPDETRIRKRVPHSIQNIPESILQKSMVEDYQQGAPAPSLPLPTIIVQQQTALKSHNHLRTTDARDAHSCRARQILQGKREHQL